MRSKEDANDYRFFPEPDIPPFEISRELVTALAAEIPMLPDERKARYETEFGLSPYDADILVSQKSLADIFEAAAELTTHRKTLANLLIGEGLRLCEEDFSCPISAKNLAALSDLSAEGVIGSSTAKKLFARIWKSDEDPCRIVDEEKLALIRDRALLTSLVAQVLSENPSIAEDFRRGKTFAAKSAIGKVMSKTGGRAEPILLGEIVAEELKKKL
jgi:aspartyl-tRNA(Asn)/glutamyl-tRNA(Gln) amidotransferase subunit B